MPGAVVAKEGGLLEDLTIVTQGYAAFERRGQVLMDLVGPGAYWGELSLVQVAPLCYSARGGEVRVPPAFATCL